MSEEIKLNVLILWEAELRAASKLLRIAREETNEDLVMQRMTEAYAACEAALIGIEEHKAVVICGNDALFNATQARRNRSRMGKGEDR
jgi:hypothetical protein